MKVFVLDNYDSFTFNLVHYLEPVCDEITVKRHGQFNIEDVRNYHAILISPGPGLPKEAGSLMPVIERYHQQKPIFGICLGFQALFQFFGGQIRNMDSVKHGKQSSCCIYDKTNLFSGLPDEIMVGRYHSWAALPEDKPDCFRITAQTSDSWVMGASHETLPIHGVQFHPESIMTEFGKEMIKNWVHHIKKQN